MKKDHVRAVIFDLDGTLLDTESLSCRAVIESFAATGLTIPKNILATLREGGFLLPWELKRRILGLRGSDWVPIVFEYAQSNWELGIKSTDWNELVDVFWKAWEARLNELCHQVAACPGALELVDGLTRLRIPMAIATSSRSDSVRKKMLKHETMLQSIQVIVAGDDPSVVNGKPAPDIYLEAAKRLGMHPSECLVFEDAITGAQSGKSAGCFVVAVPDYRMEREPFRRVSDDVIDTLWQFSGQRWGIPLDMKKIRR